jgi:hypothetical protein
MDDEFTRIFSLGLVQMLQFTKAKQDNCTCSCHACSIKFFMVSQVIEPHSKLPTTNIILPWGTEQQAFPSAFKTRWASYPSNFAFLLQRGCRHGRAKKALVALYLFMQENVCQGWS